MSGGAALWQVDCDASVGDLQLRLQVEGRAPWTVIFGPSGSGKTSLLRLMAGLWRPTGARMWLGGEDLSHLPAHRRGIALVAQQPALFRERTIRGNVAFGAANRAVVDELLAQFGLTTMADASVTHLSGGEAQRVCLARALAARPRLLLLDESFTGLHRGLRNELWAMLRAGRERLPILSVTHDVGEAFACADEVLRLEAGEVTARGSADVVLAAERDDLLRQMSPEKRGILHSVNRR